MSQLTGLGIRELLAEKRESILQIAAKHGAYNVRVFGSVARGEATETSDIDLLIDYDRTRISSWFPGGLIIDLQELIDRNVDIATEVTLHPVIRSQVLQEAISL